MKTCDSLGDDHLLIGVCPVTSCEATPPPVSPSTTTEVDKQSRGKGKEKEGKCYGVERAGGQREREECVLLSKQSRFPVI